MKITFPRYGFLPPPDCFIPNVCWNRTEQGTGTNFGKGTGSKIHFIERKFIYIKKINNSRPTTENS